MTHRLTGCAVLLAALGPASATLTAQGGGMGGGDGMGAMRRVERPVARGLPPATGYVHVVVTPPMGRRVHVAGQVAWDSTGAIVGRGDFRVQAEQVFRNLERALAAGGASWADVVSTTTYVTDMQHLPILREVRARYLSAGALPTSTAVQVVALAQPGLLLEISAEAFVPMGGMTGGGMGEGMRGRPDRPGAAGDSSRHDHR